MKLWCFPAIPAISNARGDALRQAAASGESLHLASLLSSTPPDPRQPEHESALQLAAKGGHLSCVEALVAAGADVNRVAGCGLPPLGAAAASGSVEVVRALLSAGADPTLSWDGWNAFHVAARCGHVPVLRVLAEAVPDVQALAAAPTADGGKAPLHMASSSRKGCGAVRWLLQAGADVFAADMAGNTALHAAALSGNVEAARVLLAAAAAGGAARAGELVNAVNGRGRTAAHAAAAAGQAQLLGVLLHEAKASAQPADKAGSTLLHVVAQCCMCTADTQASMARLALDAGVDAAAKDKGGKTALHYAPPALRALLEGGSGTNAWQLKSAAVAAAAAPTAAAPGTLAAHVHSSGGGSSGSGGSDWAAKHSSSQQEEQQQGAPAAGGWKLKAAAGQQRAPRAAS